MCAPKGARSERRGAPQVATTPEVVRAPPDMSSYVAGVARAGGRARLLRAAEQASCRVGIRRRRGGTRGRWQGGVAPSQGVALNRLGGTRLAVLCCEQRRRLAAARLPQLRGVRQRVLAVESARECAPERATRDSSRFQSASVCVCGHSRASRGACSRPRTNATVSACSRLRTYAEIVSVNARVPWTNAIFGGE